MIDYVSEAFAISVSESTVRRFLHAHGFRWKRKRKRPAGARDEELIRFFQQEILELKKLEDAGSIDLYFFDEAGFSLQSYVPYAWQKVGQTRSIPASQGGHMTVMGMINRGSKGAFKRFDKAPKADDIIAFFDQVAETINKKTVVILDNAPTHKAKAVEAKLRDWKQKNLLLQFIPPYAPELNLIEILWRRIKYKWLTPDSFLSKNNLKNNLETILGLIGQEYVVNFA